MPPEPEDLLIRTYHPSADAGHHKNGRANGRSQTVFRVYLLWSGAAKVRSCSSREIRVAAVFLVLWRSLEKSLKRDGARTNFLKNARHHQKAGAQNWTGPFTHIHSTLLPLTPVIRLLVIWCGWHASLIFSPLFSTSPRIRMICSTLCFLSLVLLRVYRGTTPAIQLLGPRSIWQLCVSPTGSKTAPSVSGLS